jgi:hypothetical protein
MILKIIEAKPMNRAARLPPFFTSFRDVDNSEPDSQKSETTSAADSRTIITFSLNATKNDDKK